MHRPWSSLVAGALSGAIATLLMSVVMIGARRAGLTPELPPVAIAERVIEATTDRDAAESEQRVVATAAHFAFGASAGALFGLFGGALRRLPSGALLAIGGIYAAGIWFVSYQGWVPMLRILPPASRDDPGRVGTMVVAHAVYGATLGLLTRAIQRRLSAD